MSSTGYTPRIQSVFLLSFWHTNTISEAISCDFELLIRSTDRKKNEGREVISFIIAMFWGLHHLETECANGTQIQKAYEEHYISKIGKCLLSVKCSKRWINLSYTLQFSCFFFGAGSPVIIKLHRIFSSIWDFTKHCIFYYILQKPVREF